MSERHNSILSFQSENEYFDFEGIRFTPSSLVFNEVFDGEKRTLEFSLQNVSPKPVHVVLRPPMSLAFLLAEEDFEARLAPGLRHTNSLSFTHYINAVTKSSMPVSVNCKSVDYNIIVKVARPGLVVTPLELDFGNVDLGAPAVVRYLKFYNCGALATKFAIDLGVNELDLTVYPLKGSIRPRTEVKIRFELVGIFEGEHTRDIWIKGPKMPQRMMVRVRVLQPHLVVHHLKTTGDFTLIDFPVTYFGAQRHEMLVVRNISAQTSMFVVLAEVKGELLRVNLATKTIPGYNMFNIEPIQGRIESFEGRIFTLNFNPTSEVNKLELRKNRISKDFLIFLRIMRVQCIDYNEIEEALLKMTGALKPLHESHNATAQLELNDELQESITGSLATESDVEHHYSHKQVARLCLHGIAVCPAVDLVPDFLDFGALSYASTSTRVLIIANSSAELPVHFRYCKSPFFDMRPPAGVINPGKNLEVAINATACKYGKHSARLKIDILGRSTPMLKEPILVKLDCCSLGVKFVCPGKVGLPPPTFNMGITPMITNEVGKLADGIKFRSANFIPWSTMVRADLCKYRTWIKKEPIPIMSTTDSMNVLLPPNADGNVIHSNIDFQVAKSNQLKDILDDTVFGAVTHGLTCPRYGLPYTTDDDPSCYIPDTSEVKLVEHFCNSFQDVRSNAGDTLDTSSNRLSEGVGSSEMNKKDTAARIDTVVHSTKRKTSSSGTSVTEGKDDSRQSQERDQGQYFIGKNSDTVAKPTTSGKESVKETGVRSIVKESILEIISNITDRTAASTQTTERRLGSTLIPEDDEEQITTISLNHSSQSSKTNAYEEYSPFTTEKYRKESRTASCKPSQRHLSVTSESRKHSTKRTSTEYEENKNRIGRDVPSSQRKFSIVDSKQPHHVASSERGSYIHPQKIMYFDNTSKHPQSNSSKITIRNKQPKGTDSNGLIMKESKLLSSYTNALGDVKEKSPSSAIETGDKKLKKKGSSGRGRSSSSNLPKSNRISSRQTSTSGMTFDQIAPINMLKYPRLRSKQNLKSEELMADFIKINEKETKTSSRAAKLAAETQRRPPETKTSSRAVKRTAEPQRRPPETSSRAVKRGTEPQRRPPETETSSRAVKRATEPQRRPPETETSSRDMKRAKEPQRRPPETETSSRDMKRATEPHGRSLETSPTVDRILSAAENADKKSSKTSKQSDRSLHANKKAINGGDVSEESVLSLVSTLSSGTSMPKSRLFGLLEPVPIPDRALRVRQCALDQRQLLAAPAGSPEDALVALPNDRARSLRPWHRNKLVRTIFTGKPRYAAPVDSDYALTPEEIHARQQHEDCYLQFIRTVGQRLQQGRLKRWGMDLKPAAEYDVSNQALYQMMRMRPPDAVPPNIIAPKVNSDAHKPHPLAEVLLPLTPFQLYNVKVNPKAICFGKVAAKSNTVETLQFENLNMFLVKIRLIPGRSGVTLPYGDTKILKPNQKERITMVYNAEFYGRYNGYMDYVINDNHSFKVTVSAEVVAKTLDVVPETLIWGMDSKDVAFPSRNHFVTIRNPLEAYCKFSWSSEMEHSAFTVIPMEGVIPPRRQMFCEVIYEANKRASNFSELILETESGSQNHLVCNRVIQKLAVSLLNSKLDMNEIPLNLPRVFHTLLYNSSHEDALYVVMNATPIQGCVVSPASGIIRARSYFTLNVLMQITAVVNLDFFIVVLINHSSQLDLKVVGSVKYPQVVIRPDILRMPRISADSTESLMLSMANHGKVEAVIAIPMDEYPEYHISSTPKSVSSTCGDNSFSLMPGESRSLYVIFNPIDVASYEFYLPIVINGVLGPPNIDVPDSIKTEYYLEKYERFYLSLGTIARNFPPRIPVVRVDCTVARHVITFSTQQFNFALLPGDVQRSKVSEELEVTNENRNQVTFCIRLDKLAGPNSPFRLEHKSGVVLDRQENILVGTLNPGESTVLVASFEPADTGFFGSEAAVYVQGNNAGKEFNYLFFRGLHPAPTIKSAVSHVFFAPIPLHVNSERIIYLDAFYHRKDTKVVAQVVRVLDDGFHNLNQTLKVQFLDGDTVHGMRGLVSLSVSLLFNSDFPTSFTTKVIFKDNTGAECHIGITATADNCVLTTHAFLRMRSDKYQLVGRLSSDDFTAATNTTDTDTPREGESDVQSLISADTEIVGVRCEAPAEHSAFQLGPSTIMSEPMPPQLTVKGRLSETNINYSSLSLIESDADNHRSSNNSTSSEDTLARQPVPFPRFPNVTHDPEYVKHMTRTLETMERWLHEQGFHSDFGASIPLGVTSMMAGYVTSPKTVARKRSFVFTPRSIIEVLTNLVGNEPLKFFSSKPAPDDTGERVDYLVSMYRRLLDLLNKQGAQMAHVKAHLLLNYEDYLVYLQRLESSVLTHHTDAPQTEDNAQSTIPNGPPLNSDTFDELCKQAWLDVILQIAKTLFLKKISMDNIKEGKPSRSPHTSSSALSMSSIATVTNVPGTNDLIIGMDPLDSNVYSTAERVLLSWLNANYSLQRDLLWMPGTDKETPAPKNVVNFESDLADGLVLTAVTATYCPYLVPQYLTDLYLNPQSIEQAYHNAGRLISAWRAVWLGFTVYADDIVHPNVPCMVLLVAHLHNNLPSLYARTIIRFSTPLATEVTRRIHLANPSSKHIVYQAVIVGDHQGFFSISKPGTTIQLAGHDKLFISVLYRARKIAHVTATLVLCGSAFAPNYARNIAFRLEGYPSSLRVTASFDLSAPLYRPTPITLPIQPPFNKNADYDIWCTEVEPKNSSTFQATPWRDLRLLKVPRRLFLNKSHLVATGTDSVASLHLTISCFIPTRRVFWLAFMHADVGDFIIKITITPKMQEMLKKISVAYPKDWSRVDCHCVHPRRGRGMSTIPCALQTSVPIPCRNHLLWSAISTMFAKTLNDKERQFWTSHLETNIGLRLIQWLLGDEDDSMSQEFAHIFNVTVTYNVSCSSPMYVRAIEQITICDVRQNTSVGLPIHVSNKTPKKFTFTLTLTSLDKKEIRNYRVELVTTETQPMPFSPESFSYQSAESNQISASESDDDSESVSQ